MLEITVGGTELYDELNDRFIREGGTVLQLEHSLVSLSKWESKYERPFLDQGAKKPKTSEELIEYIRFMCITPNIPPELFQELSPHNFEQINAYLNKKMTATWFSDAPGQPKTSEAITSELIYFWMTVFNIDFECQYWHLNRLFTLIRICNIKQGKQKKMSKRDIAEQHRQLNAQRRAQWGTKG